MVGWVEKHIGTPHPDKTVVLSGMAFKGNPETSDLRGSSSVYIAQKLYQKGYKLLLHDFVASPQEVAALGLGECVDDLDRACESASALCVLNNHRKYSGAALTTALKRDDFPVLDTWGACAELRTSGKKAYWTFGNMLIEGEHL